MTAPSDLDQLRTEVEQTNFELLALLSQRAELVARIQRLKAREGIPTHVPEREQQMLERLVHHNAGPFPDETICRLFREIFRASVAFMQEDETTRMMVSRTRTGQDLVVRVRNETLGALPQLIAGPCAIESEEQMDEVARALVGLGVRWLRGGAFKPRTTPYAFQGLGERGLAILRETGRRHGLVTVTEVTDTRRVGLVAEYADVLQVGSRSMYNYELLRELGRIDKPVLLKRGLSATLDELLWSAEYIVSGGNEQVILCERGIRTYERETRNTLDVSAVALLRQQSYLPVIVDVSHAAGRRDILAPLARAALGAGAQGIMVEVHPCPAVARSDSQQQLDLDAFARFAADIGLAYPPRHARAS